VSFAASFGHGLAGVVQALTLPLGRRHRVKALGEASARIAPILEAETPYGTLRFRCPNGESSRIPARLLTFEPETIRWLDAVVGADDCLWDIGGHVGSYALYAGIRMRRGAGKVLAFEPSAANYAALNNNIFVSGLSDKVSAYCLALSDKVSAGSFHMKSPEPGGVLNAFGAPENFNGEFAPTYSQAMISYSVDEAIATFGFTPPDHVKLDVDSIEEAILRGAEKALMGVKSLIIEVEVERGEAWRERVFALLEAAGLHLTEQPGKGTGRNFLFTRG
jgi:FkbM family methyltransferase